MENGIRWTSSTDILSSSTNYKEEGDDRTYNPSDSIRSARDMESIAIATHSFSSNAAKELNFEKDDRIIILKKASSGWALGKIRIEDPNTKTISWKTGWFPLSKSP